MPGRPILHLAALAAILFTGSSCANRLTGYQNLLVGELATETAPPGPGELSITYLGVNGYLLRSGGTAILVDPYVTRVPLREVALNAPIRSSDAALNDACEAAALPSRVDAILVTHSHFDHLLDVPALQKRLGGKVILSRSGAYLCEASSVPASSLLPSAPGSVHRVRSATITVLAAEHDKVLGRIPYRGIITEPLESAPLRPKDWVIGTPLAFLIEMDGYRIYLESGGVRGTPPSVSDVDLAIVGTAVGDVERYTEAVKALQAQYVLPSHQDNFFIPLKSGFQFSALSDFPRHLSAHRALRLPGELVLMDYFHTWTLPGPGKTPLARPDRDASVFGTVKSWFRSWFPREEG